MDQTVPLNATKSSDDEELNKALRNLEEFYPQGRGKEEELRQYYDTWSEKYDHDMEKLNYNVPMEMSKIILKIYDRNNTELKFLDVGAGTGLVGRQLVNLGYKGDIHALDFSAKMLEKLPPNIYSSKFCHTMTPSVPMPVENNLYDAITIGGTYGPSAMSPKCTRDIVKALKPSGHVFISMRVTDQPQIQWFWKELSNEFDSLEAEGKWKKVDVKVTSLYSWETESNGGKNQKEQQQVSMKIFSFMKC